MDLKRTERRRGTPKFTFSINGPAFIILAGPLFWQRPVSSVVYFHLENKTNWSSWNLGQNQKKERRAGGNQSMLTIHIVSTSYRNWPHTRLHKHTQTLHKHKMSICTHICLYTRFPHNISIFIDYISKMHHWQITWTSCRHVNTKLNGVRTVNVEGYDSNRATEHSALTGRHSLSLSDTHLKWTIIKIHSSRGSCRQLDITELNQDSQSQTTVQCTSFSAPSNKQWLFKWTR